MAPWHHGSSMQSIRRIPRNRPVGREEVGFAVAKPRLNMKDWAESMKSHPMLTGSGHAPRIRGMREHTREQPQPVGCAAGYRPVPYTVLTTGVAMWRRGEVRDPRIQLTYEIDRGKAMGDSRPVETDTRGGDSSLVSALVILRPRQR